MSLNGLWRFQLSERLDLAPDAFWRIGFDDSSWEQLAVPSSWPMHGHGAPIYTNVRYPFPLDPPHVPDANPIGDHRLRFHAGPEFARRSVLRFDGVDSAADVWLNERFLGSIRGSRLATEFDVRGVLVEGENVLAVRVARWSAASYLEDQDMWWLPGIFRPVTLIARPDVSIEDIGVRAEFDAATASGSLSVDVAYEGDPREVRVEVPELDAMTIAGESLALPGVSPWSAESPRLYDVVVSTPHESVTIRAGFRTITTDGGVLRLNGRPLTLHGVNRHEHHPELGRVVPMELVREELLLMKQHNINAIRTSHYPPHPAMLELTDELGFYVMVENDYESHGFLFTDWRDNPSDSPEWRDAILDRMRRTVHRDKNHASVVAWSLGNEAGEGIVLRDAARLVKQLDPSRPVHYEGDPRSPGVDFYSRMYPTVAEVEEIGRRAEPPLSNGSEDAHRRGLPFVMCEYAHAMGNGPGGLLDYEEQVRNSDRIAGGFVWEWLEHGIARTAPDGTRYFAYGGDFGEVVHDGNFVADGLVDAWRVPRPGLADVKKTFEPVSLELDLANGLLRVVNRYAFSSTAHLEFVWLVERDGREVECEQVDVPPVAPGSTGEARLPLRSAALSAGQTATVSARLGRPYEWAAAGHEVAWTQTPPIPSPAPAPDRPAVEPVEREGRLRLGPADFDPVTGVLVSLFGTSVVGSQLTLWRAPTDNDLRAGTGAERPDAEDWAEAGLDRLERRLLSLRRTARGLEIVERYAAAAEPPAADVRLLWSSDGDDLQLAVTIVPGRGAGRTWARAGLTFALDASIGELSWLGLGPGQVYPDTGHSQRHGRHVRTLEGLQVPYVRPQENGRRASVSELEFTLKERTVRVCGDFAFTARPWSDHALDSAAHTTDVVPDGLFHLTVDFAAHGIGTASCGPGVAPRHVLVPREITGALRFSTREDEK